MRALTFAVMLLSTAAYAENKPEYVHKFNNSLGYCKPSCYQNQPAIEVDASKVETGCAFNTYSFKQPATGGGKFGTLELRGIPSAKPQKVDCKFPKDSGGKWAATAKAAKAAIKPAAGDLANLRFVVDGDWKTEKDNRLQTWRYVHIKVYGSNYTIKPNECGEQGNVVCEPSNNPTARAFNYLRYRLDEAKKQGENQEACQVASYAAVGTARGLKKSHDGAKKNGEWTNGSTYLTRYDGKLSEPDLFKLVDDSLKEAEALHQKCGGTQPLVTDDEVEFKWVPKPS
jgi:hypothetical protein